MIHPSIDLMGGKAVQLRRGDPADCVVTVDDPVGLAERFHRHGEVAVIDLDAALGRGDNLATIEAICARIDCRVGGGIRDHARADRLLRMGACKLIVGTAATPAFLGRYPRNVLVVALDSKGGKVVEHGWTTTTDDTAVARARRLGALCSEFLFTVVEREGMLGGTDLDAVRAVVDATPNRVVAAGGITTLAEVAALDAMGASCQLGMAIYTGRLDLGACVVGLGQWEKGGGLLPVVTQDAATGQVLMVAHATPAALQETLESGRAVYWSRSRAELWRKGETSGHVQHVRAVRWDCDRDALLYVVDQTGRACHLDQHGCFGDAAWNLGALDALLGRQATGLQTDAGSYTARLLNEPGLAEAKVLEEAHELVAAGTRTEARWEGADVLFHTLALLRRRGVGLAEVERELRGRRERRRS
ncbi:MAG: phosphoribosyl-AMP cyclohydrolase [Myxococcales bacterium]|nr:phosphoribosyl-AMP cyclohydrolase [Myxococcales bacterium]